MSKILQRAAAELSGAGATQPTHERLQPDQIRTDGGTQMRAGLNLETVQEYIEAIPGPNSWPFPPVLCYYDGTVYWLADGFHRVEAARQYAQREEFALTIPVEVRSGTRRDAVLHAAGANASHGLRRTNADKRRAVETLLRDEVWQQWSDREIARRCAVHHEMVGRVRSELSGGFRQIERTVQRGDSTYTMNTASHRQAEQRRPAQSIQPNPTQPVVAEPSAPTLPADLIAAGCKLETDGGWFYVRYGGHRDTCGSLEQAINWCRRMTSAPAPAATPAGKQKQSRVSSCPFCGSDKLNYNRRLDDNTYRVECRNCDAGGPRGKSMDEATTLWNVRAVTA